MTRGKKYNIIYGVLDLDNKREEEDVYSLGETVDRVCRG